MRKIIFINITLCLLFIISIKIFDYKSRAFIYSHDGNKVVTLYLPFYIFSNNYYVIPYKYTGVFSPSDDYCRYQFTSSSGFPTTWTQPSGLNINWYPKNKLYYIKFGNCEKEDNKLITAYGGKFFYDDEAYFNDSDSVYNNIYSDKNITYDKNKYSLQIAEAYLDPNWNRKGSDYSLIIYLILLLSEVIAFVIMILYALLKIIKFMRQK